MLDPTAEDLVRRLREEIQRQLETAQISKENYDVASGALSVVEYCLKEKEKEEER